jgi:hypothetical protein
VPSRENGNMLKNEGESMGNELHHMNVSPDPVRRLRFCLARGNPILVPAVNQSGSSFRGATTQRQADKYELDHGA